MTTISYINITCCGTAVKYVHHRPRSYISTPSKCPPPTPISRLIRYRKSLTIRVNVLIQIFTTYVHDTRYSALWHLWTPSYKCCMIFPVITFHVPAFNNYFRIIHHRTTLLKFSYKIFYNLLKEYHEN